MKPCELEKLIRQYQSERALFDRLEGRIQDHRGKGEEQEASDLRRAADLQERYIHDLVDAIKMHVAARNPSFAFALSIALFQVSEEIPTSGKGTVRKYHAMRNPSLQDGGAIFTSTKHFEKVMTLSDYIQAAADWIFGASAVEEDQCLALQNLQEWWADEELDLVFNLHYIVSSKLAASGIINFQCH